MDDLAAHSSEDPIVRFRVFLTALLVVYLVATVATGYLQLSPEFDVPFALAGWLVFAGVIIWAAIRRRKYDTDHFVASLIRPVPLTIAFVFLLVVTSYFMLAWQVPAQCNALSLSCLKGYEWHIQDGRFYHVIPDGSSVQISRAGYVQEVGVHLRSAAAFGVYSLCFAWAAAIALRRQAGPEPVVG